MIRTIAVSACTFVLCTLPAFAQDSRTLVIAQKGLHALVTNNLIRATEKMPEDKFAFKATDEVRSFGQLVGHVADAQYMFCSIAMGEQPSARGIEKSKTSKADLLQALKDATAFCDKAYEMTDAQATQAVKLFGREMPKLTVLSLKTAHDNEHYGNIVTYMRLNKLVPPSSEPRR
jgi:uncharacterized damage-inducible protein DinB